MNILEFCTVSNPIKGLDKRAFTVVMSYHSVDNDNVAIVKCYSVDSDRVA